MAGERALEMHQRLPVPIRTRAQQENPHGALTADAQSPEKIVGTE